MCRLLLNEFNDVSKAVVTNKAFSWLMKRLLVICLKNLKNKELRTSLLDFIEKFTRNPELIEFIIMQGKKW